MNVQKRKEMEKAYEKQVRYFTTNTMETNGFFRFNALFKNESYCLHLMFSLPQIWIILGTLQWRWAIRWVWGVNLFSLQEKRLKELKKSGQSKKQADAKVKAQAKQKGGKQKQAEQEEIQVCLLNCAEAVSQV